jgi:hypothetical protein
MSQNPQDRNRLPGQNEEREEMEKMPRKRDKSPGGHQGANQGERGSQPDRGDSMNRPKDTDEGPNDRKKRSA